MPSLGSVPSTEHERLEFQYCLLQPLPPPTYMPANGGTSFPMLSLPQELQELILGLVQGDYFVVLPDGSVKIPYLADTPLVTSHVCKYWRAIALDNPSLWSNIVVTNPWKLEKVDAYLRRSQQCVIELQVYLCPTYGNTQPPPRPPCKPLFDLLAPHYSRCRRIEIRGPSTDGYDLESIRGASMGIDASLPDMECLILDTRLSPFMNDFMTYANLPVLAPRLRELRIGTIKLWNFDNASLKATGIRTLHLRGGAMDGRLSFPQLRLALQACPNLESLAVYGDILQPFLYDPDMVGRFCSVPRLIELQISGTITRTSEFLMYLDAPGLKELTIAPYAVGDLAMLLMYPDSIGRGGTPAIRFPHLRALALAPAENRARNYAGLPRASECFPCIQRLVLAKIRPEHFRHVFVDSPTTVFPNLTELALTGVDVADVEMIEDVHDVRIEDGIPLQTIYLDTVSVQNIGDKVGSIIPQTSSTRLIEKNIWECKNANTMDSSRPLAGTP